MGTLHASGMQGIVFLHVGHQNVWTVCDMHTYVKEYAVGICGLTNIDDVRQCLCFPKKYNQYYVDICGRWLGFDASFGQRSLGICF